METVNISKRLQKASEYTLAQQPIADIGSDHAYLPIYLIQRKVVPSAIVGEVAEGPLKNAQDTVNSYHLDDKVSIRLGDGLSVLTKEDEVGTIFICGMGGLLIKQILAEGKQIESLPQQVRLVLQPNNKEKELREFLMESHYQIIEEEIIEENNKIYEIIIAEYTNNPVQYTEDQLFFGPKLMKRKTNTFLKKWESILDKNVKIQEKLKKASDSKKNHTIDEKIKRIKKVLE